MNRPGLAEVVLAASGDGIVVFDRELVCSYWNAAVERMLGIEASQVLGAPLPAELLAALGPEAPESLARVFAGEEVHLEDCAYPTRDGVTAGPAVYFEASYVPWRGPDRSVVGGIGILRDTSRRREAERRAAETESRFRIMADVAPVLLWMAGTDALCTFFNQTWLDFTGRTLEEEWGVGWAEGVHHEDFQRCVDTYMEAFAARRTFEMEYRLRRHDGQYRWVLDRGTPRHSPDGTFEGYIGSCVDITDRKDIELDLVRAVRLRDEFLSIASHELRTPITALQLQLDSVARSLDRRAEEHLASGRLSASTADARQQVARLRALVERLLDISRFSEGRFSLDCEELDLAQLVGRVVEVMREPARLAGCELLLHPCAPVRGTWDRVRVEQVVTNLVSNALKFGAGRPIEVSLGEQGGAARLAVQDHGVGIEPRYHRRIFRRFERAVSSRNFGGLGLGLWVAKEIVDAHAGTISVESTPGEGATFVVMLPVVATGKLREDGVTPDADGILVIEDDADILRAILQVLGDEGHDVRGAGNGLVALEMLRQPNAKRPRLILLDLMMPLMDGWAFRAEQLRDPALADIPVIILTADGSAHEKSQLMNCAAGLRKPVELEELLATIERYV